MESSLVRSSETSQASPHDFTKLQASLKVQIAVVEGSIGPLSNPERGSPNLVLRVVIRSLKTPRTVASLLTKLSKQPVRPSEADVQKSPIRRF